MAKLEKVLRTQNPSKICKCEKLEKWKYLVAILSADLEWSDLDGSGISWWDDRGINHLFIQQCPHNLPMHLHWAGKQFSPYPAITISLFCSWGYPWQRNISNQMMKWKSAWWFGDWWKESGLLEGIGRSPVTLWSVKWSVPPWPSSPGLVWSHHPLAKINIPQNKGWLGWLGTILMPTQV